MSSCRMTTPIGDLEAEEPGVPLSDLLVDIEPRAITTCKRLLDDDDGAMDQQGSYVDDDCGEEAVQVPGHTQGYLLKMLIKWLMM
ncbi:predicted protein [Lichtheimia corymbifera JMRC:FSU:9682]|uniref:Uncharacterized protein n=1 Tax=Lichtheimia corymbifera JMRC:FSU:9682 TaxID=1263082 RepID=A0A068SGG9_9FUNG|nr:predicted protein [Lichtheimia corymbifera JMRC:FSU:9682]